MPSPATVSGVRGNPARRLAEAENEGRRSPPPTAFHRSAERRQRELGPVAHKPSMMQDYEAAADGDRRADHDTSGVRAPRVAAPTLEALAPLLAHQAKAVQALSSNCMAPIFSIVASITSPALTGHALRRSAASPGAACRTTRSGDRLRHRQIRSLVCALCRGAPLTDGSESWPGSPSSSAVTIRGRAR